MRHTVPLLAWLMVLGSPSLVAAGPGEDVAAATRAWVDAFTSHDVERLLALYDPEATLWGTVSLTLRDNPAAIRDYFKGLSAAPPGVKVELGEQHIRVYGDMAINTGTYTFAVIHDGTLAPLPARFSFVYRNRNGRWLIVEHHSSTVSALLQ